MKLSLPKLSTLVSLLLCWYISLFVTSPAHAQAQNTLVVSPPRIDLEGQPGETLQQVIKLTNSNSSDDVTVKAFAVDFIVEDDAGTPIQVTEAASGRFLASPWFTLDQTEFSIPAKSTTSLTVLVTIPDDALPGGHYAGVFFQPIAGKGSASTVSYTAQQIGSLFGVTVAGDIKYDALIKDFSVKNMLSEFGPIEFSANIENQSDTHIRPNSSIVIHDMIGRQLEEISLDELNIFPFASRTLSGVWETVWGLGRYTATLSSSYGPGLVASRTIYFWIMPYRLIAAVLVVLLVILVVFILVRRHLKHREDRRDEVIDELKRKIVEMENKSR